MIGSKDEPVGIKIVILGNSGAGKSSLISRWINGEWQDDLRPTIGASHLRKRMTLDGEDVDICIWDTAGQEQFQALTPLYSRGAMFGILTASIVDEDSISDIPKWKETLDNTCDTPPPFCLVINKIDLATFDQQNELEERLKDQYPSIFFVSAKTGENVEELFMYAAINGNKFYQGSSTKRGKEQALVETEQNNKKCC